MTFIERLIDAIYEYFNKYINYIEDEDEEEDVPIYTHQFVENRN